MVPKLIKIIKSNKQVKSTVSFQKWVSLKCIKFPGSHAAVKYNTWHFHLINWIFIESILVVQENVSFSLSELWGVQLLGYIAKKLLWQDNICQFMTNKNSNITSNHE